MNFENELARLKSKLNDLEMKKQVLRERQDSIDDLALDTLYKMKVLLAKVKTVQNLAAANVNNETNGVRDQREGNLANFYYFTTTVWRKDILTHVENVS